MILLRYLTLSLFKMPLSLCYWALTSLSCLLISLSSLKSIKKSVTP